MLRQSKSGEEGKRNQTSNTSTAAIVLYSSEKEI
jgi:hypothetical protein